MAIPCMYVRVYVPTKIIMDIKNSGGNVSEFFRNLAIRYDVQNRKKYNINQFPYPIQNQEQQADPAESPPRASSDPTSPPKLPEELYKLALAKQKEKGPILD